VARISPITADAPDIAQWGAIYADGRAAGSGGPVDVGGVIARLNDPTTGAFAAYVDDRLAGVATVTPDGDELAFARVYVAPAYRGRGAGRALAEAVRRWAAAQHRCGVRATVVADGPGEAFAARQQATVLLRLTTVERQLAEPAPSVPEPDGVDRLRWIDGAPAQHLAAYARLRQLVGDAPDAHLQFDASTRTAEAARAWEASVRAAGHQLWVSAAVHSGELVGFTEVEVGDGVEGAQHDTAVRSEWRGRGLGVWMKADMIDWLRTERPGINRITSTINAANAPMLAVCARLGFREIHGRLLVSVPIAD
jgi:RimJ/RimL family protein N-acetyltransferase